MKKRILALLLMSIMVLSLAACGGDSSTPSDTPDTKEPSTEEAVKDENNAGEVVEENGLRKEPVFTNKELNLTGETGPFKYSINAVQVSKLTATADDMAELLEIEKDKEVSLVVMEVSIENTTDDTNSIYFDQSVLTTNTKEQVDSNFMLSDSIGGEFLGKVVKEGSIYFVLPNTIANDLTTITLHVDAPHNDNYDNIGNDVSVELKLN